MGGHLASQIINFFIFIFDELMYEIHLIKGLAIYYVTYATSLYCGLIRHGHAKQTCHYVHT